MGRRAFLTQKGTFWPPHKVVRRYGQQIGESGCSCNSKLARGAFPIREAGITGSPTLEVDKGCLPYWKSLRRAVHARKLEKAGRKQRYSGSEVCRKRKWEARNEPQGSIGCCNPSGQLGARPWPPGLFLPTPWPQPALPRARQLLGQGHTWG